MKLENLFTFFSTYKKIFLLIVVFLCLFFIFGIENISFAVDQKVDQPAGVMGNKDADTWIQKIAMGLNEVTKIVALFLALMTYLASLFLSPEWVNGSLFGIQGYLKTIWILVSNIVYVAFAFILIGIAFVNIVGVGKDKFQLKQSLPKFIIGILIVPASWFIVQFIVSMASILSVIALNIPFDSFEGYSKHLSTLQIPSACTIDFTGDHAADKERTIKASKFFYCDDTGPLKERGDSAVEDIYRLVSLYTYGVLGIDLTDRLTSTNIFQGITDIFGIAIKIVFDVFFFLAYAILMIALGLVLMTRGFYLWIYMMMSPVFGLMYFFGKSSGGSGFFEKFNVKEFIALAMVPVYSMLALSFGMLFMYVVGQGMTTSSLWYNGSTVKLHKFDKETGAETLEIGQFSLTVVGTGSSTWGNAENWGNAAKGAEDFATGAKVLTGGLLLGGIGSIILKIMGIVVLWGAMMAALRSSTITKNLVEPLYQFGNSVGQIATKAPQYAPIFGGQSMASMQQIGSTYTGSLQRNATQRAGNFTGKFNPFDSSKIIQELQLLNSETAQANDPSAYARVFDKYMKLMNGNIRQIASNPIMRDSLKQIIDKISPNNNYDLSRESDILRSFQEIQANNSEVYDRLNRGALNAVGGNIDGLGDAEAYSRYFNKNGNSNSGNQTVGAGSSSFTTDNSTGTVDVVHSSNKGHKLLIKLNNNSNKLELRSNANKDAQIKDIAQAISEDNEEWKKKQFNQSLENEIREYFDSKGNYQSGGGQNGGKFPWEITNSSNP